MHETGIMENTLQIALQEARAAGATRLHRLRLRIGVLSGVVPEALQFAFELVSRGTMAEGGRLEIENVNAAYWCDACDKEFEPEDWAAPCPNCGQPSSLLRRGRELELTSVEIT